MKINNGERPKYYVENNHPAIIDSATFGRVQEELARRSSKRKVKQVGTKTEQGKYSSKYALTELLVCGECGTPYRRCTWTIKGQKKAVWRCISRLDFGKTYCHNSPTIDESVLHESIMTAIMEQAQENMSVLQTLKMHLGMAMETEQTEDDTLAMQIRIAEIDAEFKQMLKAVSSDGDFDENKMTELMLEKQALQEKLDEANNMSQKQVNMQSRLDEIFTILDGLKNHPIEYDDTLIRQTLECVVVENAERVKIIFKGGYEVVQELR